MLNPQSICGCYDNIRIFPGNARYGRENVPVATRRDGEERRPLRHRALRENIFLAGPRPVKSLSATKYVHYRATRNISLIPHRGNFGYECAPVESVLQLSFSRTRDIYRACRNFNDEFFRAAVDLREYVEKLIKSRSYFGPLNSRKAVESGNLIVPRRINEISLPPKFLRANFRRRCLIKYASTRANI